MIRAQGLQWGKALLLLASLFSLAGCARTRSDLPPVFDIYAFPDYKVPSVSHGMPIQQVQQLQQSLAGLKQQLKHAETKIKAQDQLISTLRKPMPKLPESNRDGHQVQLDWEQAENALKGRRYIEAKQKLVYFLRKYPSDSHRASAYYFLGQLMLIEGKSSDALSHFTTFVNQYPQDARVPDAKFNIGLAYYAKGENQRAYQIFQQIQTTYPTRQIGKQAKQECQRLEKSGVMK